MEENENQNSNPNTNKKSNKALFIVVGIMAIIIIALVAYIVVDKSHNSNQSNANENQVSSSKVSDEEKEDEEKEDDEDDDEDENKTNTSKNNTTKKSSKNNTNTSNETNTSTNTNSSFGKKNKNETNTSNTSKTTEISSDWKSGEYILDGVAYKLKSDYKEFSANGWSVDLEKAGYSDGYILNKNDKTYSTIDFENDKYDDADVNIGFINLGDSAKDITECQIWAISVNNKYSDTPVDFTLPGGIKYGSTLAEIEAVYGKPEDEKNIYRSDDLKYTVYTYDNDLAPKLRLTIYDEEGLTEFDYQTYEK